MADKVTVDLDVSMDAKAKDPDDVGNVNSANSEAESGSKSSGMDWKSLGGSEEKESSTGIHTRLGIRFRAIMIMCKDVVKMTTFACLQCTLIWALRSGHCGMYST